MRASLRHVRNAKKSCADRKEWSIKQIEDALSDEALTMAVMPRLFVYSASKRDIATKLGKF